MSPQRRDEEYLDDIHQAMHRIIAYAAGLSYEQFMEDLKTQDAVIRNLQVIGEATKKLSGRLKKAHPSLPWKQMAGMRDKVTYDYLASTTTLCGLLPVGKPGAIWYQAAPVRSSTALLLPDRWPAK